MPLDDRSLELVALGAAAAAALALLLCLVLLARLRRLARAHRTLVGADSGTTFVQSVERSAAASTALRRDVELLRDDLAAARADLSDALRHVAVVRYDAFADMGGRMSFSAALLDDAGDGLVLTSINGRSETRTYAKGVAGGTSEHSLSPEELEAVQRATLPDDAPVAARARRRLSRT
ncbi:MAG: hypothetical protein JWO60_321 [Frankiales bacterium]|nr:hypothetical protein [Frankiales bacterium]